jgi:hypothetical protein
MPGRLPSWMRIAAGGLLAAALSACGSSSQPATPPAGPALDLRRTYSVQQIDASTSTVAVAAVDGCDQGAFTYSLQGTRLILSQAPWDGQTEPATFVGSGIELAGMWLADKIQVCEEAWTFCLPQLLVPRSGLVDDALQLTLTLAADALLLDFHDARPALNEVMMKPFIDALPAYITSFRYYWADTFRGWLQSPSDPTMKADVTGSLDGSLLTLTFTYAGYACVLASDLSARLYEDFACAGTSTALTAAQLEFRGCVEQSGFMKP